MGCVTRIRPCGSIIETQWYRYSLELKPLRGY